jgi:hypothetical protein
VAALVLLCLVLYTVASFVVGARLILRSRRSHGVPELLIGLTYLAAPGIGYPLVVAGRMLPDRADQLVTVWLGQPLIVLGCACFLFFNAKVFRPGAAWATVVASLGSAGLVVGGAVVVWGYTSTADAALATHRSSYGTGSMLVVLGAAYAWTAFEGIRYRAMMRRRQAIGLADPMVANRFLLWGFAGLVSMAWNGISAVYLLAGQNIGAHPVPVISTSLGGLVCTILQVLIFMPPAWYARWVTRAPRAGASLATA